MKKRIVSLVAGLSPIFYTGVAMAQVGNIPYTNFQSAFRQIFGWIIALAGIIFVIMFLVGGIQYLTSAGNEEAAGKAKKLLIDAVIGIVVVAIAWAAGTWVLQQLNIQTGGIVQ